MQSHYFTELRYGSCRIRRLQIVPITCWPSPVHELKLSYKRVGSDKMRLKTICSIFLLFTVQVCLAQQNTPQECSAIVDQQMRLKCFDYFFPLRQDMLGNGNWQITEQKSVIDGSTEIIATLLARTMTFSGKGPQEAALGIRCSEGETSTYVVTSLTMENREPEVTYRFDDDAPVHKSWMTSTDFQSVGMWTAAEAIPFLRKLTTASKLTVRIEDKDRWEAIFNLRGVSEAVEKVRKTCNW